MFVKLFCKQGNLSYLTKIPFGTKEKILSLTWAWVVLMGLSVVNRGALHPVTPPAFKCELGPLQRRRLGGHLYDSQADRACKERNLQNLQAGEVIHHNRSEP